MRTLTNKVELERTKAIEKPVKLQVIRCCICHAVFRFVAIGFLSIVGFIVGPTHRPNGFSIRQVEEFSFFRQIGAARPKLIGEFKFKI